MIRDPLSGRFGDLHPLEYVRAGRTKKGKLNKKGKFPLISLFLTLFPHKIEIHDVLFVQIASELDFKQFEFIYSFYGMPT